MFGYAVVIPAVEYSKDSHGRLIGHYLRNQTSHFFCYDVDGNVWIVLAKYGSNMLEHARRQARTAGAMIVEAKHSASYLSDQDVLDAIRQESFMAVGAGPGLPPGS